MPARGRRPWEEEDLNVALAESPLFSLIGEEQRRGALESGSLREFNPGEFLVSEGETATSFYIILLGQVEVRQASRILARLGRGQFFGETTVADDQTRSADVVALQKTTCLVLSRPQLRQLITSNPVVALKLLEESTRRYRPRAGESAVAPDSSSLAEAFEFKSKRAGVIFDQLGYEFLLDYMSRNYLLDKSGWRTIGEIAKEAKIPLSSLYSKRGGPAPPIRELLKRGVLEMKISPGERGRGGLVTKLRVAYEKQPVKEYVNHLGHKKR